MWISEKKVSTYLICNEKAGGKGKLQRFDKKEKKQNPKNTG